MLSVFEIMRTDNSFMVKKSCCLFPLVAQSSQWKQFLPVQAPYLAL